MITCEHTYEKMIEYVVCGLIYATESELKDTHYNILSDQWSYKCDTTESSCCYSVDKTVRPAARFIQRTCRSHA